LPPSASPERNRLAVWPLSSCHKKTGRQAMPIILWILGVPLSIVILLMLFGVVSF
jgi:hypothetical protein